MYFTSAGTPISLKCILICRVKVVSLNVNILSIISENDSSNRKQKGWEILGLAIANEQIVVKYTVIVIALNVTPTSQNKQ